MSQTERLLYITRCLNENGRVETHHVCDEFGVDGRTVKRDIEYLRNRCDCDIRYDRATKFYRALKPVDMLSPGKTLLFFSYVSGMARSLSLLPLLADDIKRRMSKYLDKKHQALARAIHYRFPSLELFRGGVFDELLQAFKDRHACVIDYAKPGREGERRTIEPLRFINYDGMWYLLAHCRVAGGLRQFKLSRILTARRTGEPYMNTIDDMELDGIVESGFGIMRTAFGEAEPVWVTIRFTGTSAGIVAGQEWHPKQKAERMDGPGGPCVQLELPVESYEEILRRILFFGPEAEVVALEDFRELWKGKIREMHEKFCE